MKYYRIRQVNPLSDSLVQIFAYPESDADKIVYQAGQYVDILVGGEARPFSIANAPHGASELEFHIRHTEDNAFANALLDKLRRSGELLLGDLSGHMLLNKETDSPILMLAGGTGIAPMKAMLESLFIDSKPRRVELYWGVKCFSDLYLHERLTEWAAHIPSFSYYPILEMGFDGWTGIIGTPVGVIEAQKKDYSAYEVYAAGPFDMVQNLYKILQEQGLSDDKLFSDML